MKSSTASILRRAVSKPTHTTKPTGDISNVFPSLSGKKADPLPQRFSQLKKERIGGREAALKRSWDRLLVSLRHEVEEINANGNTVRSIMVHLKTTSDLSRSFQSLNIPTSPQAR